MSQPAGYQAEWLLGKMVANALFKTVTAWHLNPSVKLDCIKSWKCLWRNLLELLLFFPWKVSGHCSLQVLLQFIFLEFPQIALWYSCLEAPVQFNVFLESWAFKRDIVNRYLKIFYFNETEICHETHNMCIKYILYDYWYVVTIMLYLIQQPTKVL